MSVDLELWTRETGAVGELRPRPGDWERLDDAYEYEGGAWLISVQEPEEASEKPPRELGELLDGLRYRTYIGVEPSVPGDDAWVFVREILETLGAALGGAGLDPKTGRPTSWAD